MASIQRFQHAPSDNDDPLMGGPEDDAPLVDVESRKQIAQRDLERYLRVFRTRLAAGRSRQANEDTSLLKRDSPRGLSNEEAELAVASESLRTSLTLLYNKLGEIDDRLPRASKRGLVILSISYVVLICISVKQLGDTKEEVYTRAGAIIALGVQSVTALPLTVFRLARTGLIHACQNLVQNLSEAHENNRLSASSGDRLRAWQWSALRPTLRF